MRDLSVLEARVLGVLVEKALTVPDSYPLSLNTLLLGCNQKTSRDPLMELSESQIAVALGTLKSKGLVREASGGRTTRYEHNFQRAMAVPEQSAVLLGLLMLRGPQTSGELRLNTERWYRFADISSVEGFLEELQDRPEQKGGPLVAKLARILARVNNAGPTFCAAPRTWRTAGTPRVLARLAAPRPAPIPSVLICWKRRWPACAKP